jgi:sec-independent protein translocase protein TatA
MQVLEDHIASFAFSLAGGEIVLILALVLILFGAKHLPGLGRGLGRGISEFRKGKRNLGEGLDDGARDAGESLGGIYGKPAAEALTPDNQTAELYDPAVLRDNKEKERAGFLGWRRLWRRFWCFICELVRRRKTFVRPPT